MGKEFDVEWQYGGDWDEKDEDANDMRDEKNGTDNRMCDFGNDFGMFVCGMRAEGKRAKGT